MKTGWLIVAAILCAPTLALADTPSSSVFAATVTNGQSYPEVAANSEGWFDAGGFCKVVDVGDLSSFSPAASGIPVFVPGPADQWENYRTLAGSSYGGRLSLTTCCRPNANIATLCASATNPQPVSLQYGKVGEADTVTATCTATDGSTYTESMVVSCAGDNGPDGQAAWSETSDSGAPPDCYPQTISWGNDRWKATSGGSHAGETPNGEAVACTARTSTGHLGDTVALTSSSGYIGTSPTLICAKVPGSTAMQWMSSYDASTGTTSDLIYVSPYNGVTNTQGAAEAVYNTEVAGGNCIQPMCTAATVSWTADGNTCSATLANIQSAALIYKYGYGEYVPPDSNTYYGMPGSTWNAFAQGTATTLGGEANFVCSSAGQWVQQGSASCGIGQCENPTIGGSTGPCVSNYENVYDACGNLIGRDYCGPTTPPPSGGGTTAPTYCAPGTVYSSCTLQIYNCIGNPTGIYEDCANECAPLATNPNGILSTTWATPTCGNGSQCQYGISACCTNTLYTPGEITSYVCKNADETITCPSPAFPC